MQCADQTAIVIKEAQRTTSWIVCTGKHIVKSVLKRMIMSTTSYVGGGGWGNPSLLLLPPAIVWVPSLTRPPILLFWRKGLIFIFVASYGTEYTEKISRTKTCLSSMFLAKESRLDWHRMKHCLRDWSVLILLLILIHLWKYCDVNFSYILFINKSKTFFTKDCQVKIWIQCSTLINTLNKNGAGAVSRTKWSMT